MGTKVWIMAVKISEIYVHGRGDELHRTEAPKVREPKFMNESPDPTQRDSKVANFKCLWHDLVT